MNSWRRNKSFCAYYETLNHGIVQFYIICADENFENFNGNEFVKYIICKEFKNDTYHSYTGNEHSPECDYKCNIEISNGKCRYIVRNKNNETKVSTIPLCIS
ncbi:UNVERIFIED_CONTAM: hypothetical protein Cloal_1965 [Acetivibrio alkalicellulosi]